MLFPPFFSSYKISGRASSSPVLLTQKLNGNVKKITLAGCSMDLNKLNCFVLNLKKNNEPSFS